MARPGRYTKLVKQYFEFDSWQIPVAIIYLLNLYFNLSYHGKSYCLLNVDGVFFREIECSCEIYMRNIHMYEGNSDTYVKCKMSQLTFVISLLHIIPALSILLLRIKIRKKAIEDILCIASLLALCSACILCLTIHQDFSLKKCPDQNYLGKEGSCTYLWSILIVNFVAGITTLVMFTKLFAKRSIAFIKDIILDIIFD